MPACHNVRIVFSDLDDTFLAHDKSLPQKNLEALDLLAKNDIVFVPCTGRPIAGIPEALAHHPATRYLVGSNGGIIVDSRTRAVLNHSVMSRALVTAVYEKVRHLNITFDAFVPGHVLAERRRLDALLDFGIDEANLTTILSFREPHEELIPDLIAGYEGVEKVTSYWADEATRDELSQLLSTFDAIDFTTSHPRNFEFMRKGISKGSALCWICDDLGCSPDEAIAFGDSLNDLPMLVAAGDGVFVGNASPELQAQADHVCGLCDEGAVGAYLQTLLEG